VPTDWNNVAPRLGFAYLANDKLAIRGGAGVYYGMSVATNYQYLGADCFDNFVWSRNWVHCLAYWLCRHRHLNFVTIARSTARLDGLYYLLRSGGDDDFSVGTYLAVSVLRR
jgi:hypothetical protein